MRRQDNGDNLRESSKIRQAKRQGYTRDAPKAAVVMLKDGTRDIFSVVENATEFSFEGRRYTREQFATTVLTLPRGRK